MSTSPSAHQHEPKPKVKMLQLSLAEGNTTLPTYIPKLLGDAHSQVRRDFPGPKKFCAMRMLNERIHIVQVHEFPTIDTLVAGQDHYIGSFHVASLLARNSAHA